MPNRKADITIHIDEELNDEQNSELCDLLRTIDGITQARCAEHKKHLYVVEYDPEAVDSRRILDRVSARGWHAELIGL